uniref:Xylanolytic transcriptional activator regulatory domain-containing protein n=1 Tax=Bionectria ochroleuca TaxID=29856 RepID=A0A8H7NI76_BIOOC
MLLNVVYGHNCGDKTASDIASTHCAALVSLARAADLLRPTEPHPSGQDTAMDDSSWKIKTESEEHEEWLQWKTSEERKRTLFTVFVLSSILVTAYNHTPALTNSEIFLDLPCEEEYFAAESSAAFAAKGGVAAANCNTLTFHDALGELLRTNERQQHIMNVTGFSPTENELPKTDIKPSTLGCLLLIYALHNYIWETRQRHHNKTWTNEETEKMYRHIEPALKAWQTAWASNPHHSVELPNPYGMGPLSADAIPLLDLAYVRLFVNLSRSKEKFWQRDWDGVAEELARGSEIIQHAVQSPLDSDAMAIEDGDKKQADGLNSHGMSRREKHLRKAASYAADSLAMSNKLGVTFADLTSRELSLQSAICAFDCAQVLAEWIATLQDRVGQYLGILGQDNMDLTQVPAIVLLEDEDIKLLTRANEVITSMEQKVNLDQGVSAEEHRGYATRILGLTAYSLEKSAVWPVFHLMARCLETHAGHTRARAEKSVAQME